MERGRLLSLKKKIAKGNLTDIVDEIVSIDEQIPEELSAAVRASLLENCALDPWKLGKLVIHLGKGDLSVR
jgi:hypothetical protein